MVDRMELKNILSEAYKGVHEIYGEKLKEALLFGSYARGDMGEHSDIDIALLLYLDRKDIPLYTDRLIEFSVELDMKHDVLTSFRCIPVFEYERLKGLLPFYANIEKEGITIA